MRGDKPEVEFRDYIDDFHDHTFNNYPEIYECIVELCRLDVDFHDYNPITVTGLSFLVYMLQFLESNGFVDPEKDESDWSLVTLFAMREYLDNNEHMHPWWVL